MEGQKNVNDLSVVELKSILFDIDNEAKALNAKYQAVFQVLSEKLKKEKEEKPKEKKG